MDYFEKIMETLMDNKKSIPLHVRKDVLNRVFDWLEHKFMTHILKDN